MNRTKTAARCQPARRKGSGFFSRPVEDSDGKTGIHQVLRHGTAHYAQSGEADGFIKIVWHDAFILTHLIGKPFTGIENRI